MTCLLPQWLKCCPDKRIRVQIVYVVHKLQALRYYNIQETVRYEYLGYTGYKLIAKAKVTLYLN